MDAVAATIGDAAQLLDVKVDQLAGMLALVAHDRAAGPVDAGQPVHAVAGQDPIDRRAGHPQVVAESMWALTAATPGGQHPTDLAGAEGGGQCWGRQERSPRPALPWARERPSHL
jgi:hypothetical protein